MNGVTPIGLIKPDILGDEDLWGQDTNSNWDLVDQLLGSMQGNVDLLLQDFVSKSKVSPQTIAGPLTLSSALTGTTATFSGAATLSASSTLGTNTSNGIVLNVRGAAGSVRRFDYFSGAAQRWRVGVNNDAETGTGNAGSSYIFNAYDDGGVGLGSAITIIRSDRQTQLQKLKIGGAQTLTFGGGPPNNNDASLWLNYNYAGSSDGSGALNFNALNIVSDNVAVGAGQQAVGLGVQQNFGGAAYAGGRSGLRWILTQTAAINYNATLQAGYFATQANYSAGGTDVWGNANGIIYGFAIDCSIGPAATNWRGSLGLQIGYGITGTAQATGGLQISKGIDHAYQPLVPERNTIIRMSDAHSSGFMPGSDVGIMFGGAPGDWPIDTVKGKVISIGLHTYSFTAKPATAAFGVDLTPGTFTNAAFRSRNMAILGDGSLQIGAAYLAADQTAGVSLDSKGSTVTGVAIVSGGANVYVNMPLWDDNTGTILYVTAVSVGVATAVSIYRAGWAVTPPANPVTFRAQPCSPLDPMPTNPTINLTWSAPTTRAITLNPSGGPVLAAADPTDPLGLVTKRYVDNGFVPTAGANSLTLGSNTASAATLFLNALGVAGTREIRLQTAGLSRWRVYTSTNETGSGNTGTNFLIDRHDDSGALIANAMTIVRSSGAVTFPGALAGQTSLTLGTAALAPNFFLILNGAAASARRITWQTANSQRFTLGISSAVESGSNVGGDLNIVRYDDSGASLGTAFSITRSTGQTNSGGGTGTAAPGAGVLPAGLFTVWKNTTDSSVRLYYNDGGTMRSVQLT